MGYTLQLYIKLYASWKPNYLLIIFQFKTDNLDEDFLQHVGGIDNNSFTNLVQTETDV